MIVVHPGPRHAEIIERLATEHRAMGSLFSDAALAALALENGASLASCDQDFSRFTGCTGLIRWPDFSYWNVCVALVCPAEFVSPIETEPTCVTSPCTGKLACSANAPPV